MAAGPPRTEALRFGPRRVALLYVVVAASWILVSSTLVGWLPFDARVHVLIEDVKGIAFVTATGLLLGGLLRIESRRGDAAYHGLAASQATIDAYTAFVDLNPNPILVFDPDGGVILANDAAQRAAERLGGIEAFLPPATRAVVYECLATGASGPPLEHAAGQTAWRWSFFAHPGRGRVYACAVDRTEELRMKAQLARTARMESVGRLAAGLSHDFNNLLMAIDGYSSLLSADLPPGDRRATGISEIHHAVTRAEELVKRLMLLGRDRPAEERPMDLSAELRQMLPLLRHLLRPNVILHYVEAPGPVVVSFNGSELEQALMNLVANAVDAMPDGGDVTISVEVSNDSRSPMGLIRVADTGTGIPPEILPAIFDPFFTTKEAGKGTGLGLASAYSIVTAHGGTIEVENRSRGAVFTLAFPLIAPVTGGWQWSPVAI